MGTRQNGLPLYYKEAISLSICKNTSCETMPQLYIYRFMYISEPIRERPAGIKISVGEITVINKTESVSGPESIS